MRRKSLSQAAPNPADTSTLLIGYGNQGRGDDGLGPAFAARIEDMRLPGLAVDIDYQLTVDHALMIADVDRVIFADAAMGRAEPFFFETVELVGEPDIASHSLTPVAVLSLAKILYGHAAEAFVLGISGAVFGDVREGLSSSALNNLELAEAFFSDWYSSGLLNQERFAHA